MNYETSKTIRAVAIIVGVLAVMISLPYFSIFFYSDSDNIISKCNNVDTSIPHAPYEQQRNLCISEIASNRRSAEICSNIGDDTVRDYCYVTVAAKTGDASICERIMLSDAKKLCEDNLPFFKK